MKILIRNYILLFTTLLITVFFLSSCKDDVDINDPSSVSDINGNIYHTVTIGTQVWMVENLKTTKYRNGDPIPNITDVNEWSSLSTGAYCDYNNTPSNSDNYGRLYNWFAVNDSRNIAPKGWHVPTDAEWAILENYLIENGYNFDGTKTGNKIAKSIASTTGWKLYDAIGTIGASPEKNNSTGFSALPSGCRNVFGTFILLGYNSYWWCSTEDNLGNGYNRFLFWSQSVFYGDFISKEGGFSVRCLKD